jgi:formate hydrogenlyase subunit 4
VSHVPFALLSCAVTPLLSVLLVGVINRVKSRWSGRKGPPLLQLAWDVIRLGRKTPVYSSTTSVIFRLAPWVCLVSAAASSLLAPVLGAHAALSFAFDFVLFAYLQGLGRVALVLGALDTGSSFEGMGASREATYAAILEPAFFIVVGALGVVAGEHTLEGALHMQLASGVSLVVWLTSIAALTIIVQVESARIPVDDPTTHLELTMIHEVMILDHSGRDLAAMQLAAALKLTVGCSLIATLLNPFVAADAPLASMAVNVLLTLVVAAALGTVESLIARLKLRAIPQYVLVAFIAAIIALLSTTWTGPHA